MRNQCLEPALVNARELEHAVAAVARAHCPKAIFIHKGLCGHRINGREVVLHRLTTPIARDLLVPLAAKARNAAAVWRNHHIALGRHQLKVPSKAVECAHGSLRTALAVKQCGVFFGRIKIGRIKHPSQHFFAVAGGNPALLNPSARNFGVVGIVDLGQGRRSLAAQRIQFVGLILVHALCHQRFARKIKGAVVVVARGQVDGTGLCPL